MSEWDRQTTPGGAEGPQWVSAAEAADVAGVTPGTVRYWARNGLIVSEVVEGPAGEKTLVRLDEVLQYARQEGGSRGGIPPRGPAQQRSGEVVTDLPAQTSELAPILKSIPEIMAQLTAATDRAARAETKVEFLSSQLSDLRRRLAEAEAARDAAAGAAAVADVTIPEAWEKTEPPEETTPATAPEAAATAGWPSPPPETLQDEPVEVSEPGPESVDWTAGDTDAVPVEAAPVEAAPVEAAPVEEAEPARVPRDSGFSLDDIWTKSTATSDDDATGVDWHEPAGRAPAAVEEAPAAPAPRPANAPVPESDDFYGPRRRRWFRRRR